METANKKQTVQFRNSTLQHLVIAYPVQLTVRLVQIQHNVNNAYLHIILLNKSSVVYLVLKALTYLSLYPIQAYNNVNLAQSYAYRAPAQVNVQTVCQVTQ